MSLFDDSCFLQIFIFFYSFYFFEGVTRGFCIGRLVSCLVGLKIFVISPLLSPIISLVYLIHAYTYCCSQLQLGTYIFPHYLSSLLGLFSLSILITSSPSYSVPYSSLSVSLNMSVIISSCSIIWSLTGYYSPGAKILLVYLSLVLYIYQHNLCQLLDPLPVKPVELQSLYRFFISITMGYFQPLDSILSTFFMWLRYNFFSLIGSCSVDFLFLRRMNSFYQ